ncbi:MAG: hypothetical protein WA208_04515 [Thermoanaerobaculia bacterium]
MKRPVLIAVLCLAGAAAAAAGPQRQLIGMSHDHLAADATDCNHFLTKTQTSFAGNAHGQEQREIRLKSLATLRVDAGREGGVSVRGWDKPHARLIICKYAAAETEPAARALLASVQVTSVAGEILATGPEGAPTGTWWVNMILYVPRKAKLDVSSENGAIAIRNMAGSVTARATNGGISVADCDGEQKVSTVSGGISLEKIGGRLEATTETGPIAYKLHDRKTPSVEARTEEDGEILCNVAGCADGSGNWTPNRKRLRLGPATPSIRLSTASAPIIIDNVR